MNDDKPLHDRRILVTRALEQSRELKERLEALGAEVLLLPAIRFSPVEDATELDRCIAALESFDWLIFTSANAVRYFAERCRHVGRSTGNKRMPRCAAVGPVTAECATAQGFSVAYVAREFTAAALARELSASMAGARVLLPRSDRARPDLPAALAALGAQVSEVVAYRTGGAAEVEPGIMAALQNATVDAITFFSPSAVVNVRLGVGESVFMSLIGKVAMAAVGPVTAAALRDAGMPVNIQAGSTADSMAQALVDFFSTEDVPHARSK